MTGAGAELLHPKAARNRVHLVLYELKPFAPAREVQRVDRAVVNLKVVEAPHHRTASAAVFIGEARATQATFDPLAVALLAYYVTGKEEQALHLIALKQIGGGRAALDEVLTHPQVYVLAIVAIDEIHMIVYVQA